MTPRAGWSGLGERYRLVALSNGDQHLVDHLTSHGLEAEFDQCLTVDRVGRFKPHPSVYRMAAAELRCEPGDILMVAAHAFDILGARACGYRGAYVNRYGLPYEDSSLLPDLEVRDFEELGRHPSRCVNAGLKPERFPMRPAVGGVEPDRPVHRPRPALVFSVTPSLPGSARPARLSRCPSRRWASGFRRCAIAGSPQGRNEHGCLTSLRIQPR